MKYTRGFSLIEMLAVLAMAGIMGAMFSFTNSALSNNGLGEQITNDLDTIRSAALDFYYDVGKFPCDADAKIVVDPVTKKPNDFLGLTWNPYPQPAFQCANDPCLINPTPTKLCNPFCLWNGPYLMQYPAAPPGFSSYHFNNNNGSYAANCQSDLLPPPTAISVNSGNKFSFLVRPNN